jgi:hypothetical protein
VKNTSKKYILRTCSSLVIPSAQTTFTFLPAREGAKMVRAEGIKGIGPPFDTNAIRPKELANKKDDHHQAKVADSESEVRENLLQEIDTTVWRTFSDNLSTARELRSRPSSDYFR